MIVVRLPVKSQVGPEAAYETWLALGLLMIRRLRSTGEYVFRPRVVGPSGASDLEWMPASGRRVSQAATVTRRRGSAKNVVPLKEAPRTKSCAPEPEPPPIRAVVFARIGHHAGKRRKVFDLPDEAPR